MNNITNNKQYMALINDIYYNCEFNKIKKIEHHGVSRFDHSLRVSYYSYKISKILKLDSKSVARAGLLHDFFLSSEQRDTKDRIISTFKHPKISVLNSRIYFNLNNKEIDIIRCHMFPINLKLPKYAESWIVCCVDKSVAIYEFCKKFSCNFKLKYSTNVYLLFLLNFFH